MMKKHLKKSLGVLLAASMVMSSAVPAAAAENQGVSATDSAVTVGDAEESTETEAVTEQTEESNQTSDLEATPETTQETQLTVEEQTTVKAGELEDAVNDTWKDANPVSGGGTCTVEDGWLHIQSTSANGNNPDATKPPATFYLDKEFDFTKEGYFEADIKTVQAGSKNRLGIEIGFKDQFSNMLLGYNATGWYWQKFGSPIDPNWSNGAGTVPGANSTVHVRIDWTADKKATLTVDGTALYSNEEFSSIPELGNRIAIKAGSFGTETSDFYLKNIHYTGQAAAEVYTISGKVVESVDGVKKAVSGAEVAIDGKTMTTGADGSYTFSKSPGSYTIKVTKEGYTEATKAVTLGASGVSVEDIVLEKQKEAATKTISSADMDVKVYQNFPSVYEYDMKGSLADKVFFGQRNEINTIKINGQAIKVAADKVTPTFGKDTAKYVMSLKGTNVDCEITAVLTVKDNTLSFDITNVKNNLNDDTYPVQTIEIPNHSLVSVNSGQTGANIKGARTSTNTTMSGDSYYDVKSDMSYTGGDFVYAFVSNNEMSAGLWSNSENDGTAVYAGVSGGAQNTRVMATVSALGTQKSLGLGSAMWYYDRKITTKIKDNSETVSYVVRHTEMPSTKVTIAGDENADGSINWQDGAIEFRDIMHDPYKSEEVPELVSQRIAMNFGSMAANPFMTTLDGVKKVYLNTDGLGQSIILKGYGSEGHDSGHPDYDNIGERIGGAKDMNSLMEDGATMGARFGIHINASEMYPEAKAFNTSLARSNYGWNWLDQGIGINGLYDLGSGSRETRLDALKAKVGDNLDFIYLDVWGNQTSGGEDSWESRKIANQMNARGWRFATEWGATAEYNSTLQHWAADLGYGGFESKGQNSEVMRFLRNHQKDSWIADYPSYTGAAQAPLLGGLNMTDFEGWSGRTNYANYIKTMFTHNVSTKFLQHYQVTQWVDGTPVTMTSPKGATYQWTPEMKITLQDKSDNKVVVQRGSNDFAKDLKGYRSRTITLNGKEVLRGAVSGGDGSNAGDETYLLPWLWDKDGNTVEDKNEKLYHWNTKGGDTTWDLPDGWTNLQNVVLYRLNENGKVDETAVPVENGQIKLTNIEAGTPYVVYKGEQKQLDVSWQSSPYVYDTGFNSGNLNYWTITGTGKAELYNNSSLNPMLKMSGAVSLKSQKLTNLVPGQKYALYVGVDSRSDAKAYLSVESAGKVLASNYTRKSIVTNIISSDQHNTSNGPTTGGTSYFQNMFVFFTAPSTDVTLTLKRDAGAGDTYMDDIRVVETKMNNVIEKDKNGVITEFYQDFENNNQGVYPFAIAGPGGVTDNRIHLSEAHTPYTNKGYRDKKVDDVLDGNWSVKVNGLCSHVDKDGNRNNIEGMIYQTIPQNFRFEPGVTYNVSFKYQMGSEDIYRVAVGNGEFSGDAAMNKIPAAIGSTNEYNFTIIGDESGQSWFGIYATGVYADLKEFSASENGPRDFSGYKDFILDDLTIKVSDVQKKDLQDAVKEANEKYQVDYTAETWTPFAAALTAAQAVLDKQDANKAEVESATQGLKTAMSALSAIVGTVAGQVTDSSDKPLAGAEITLTGENVKPITFTTGQDGKYELKDLFIRDYTAKVTKEGYTPIYASEVTIKAGESTQNGFKLSLKEMPMYYDYFNDGDISGMVNLTGNPSQIEISAAQIDGNDAVMGAFGSDRPSIIDTKLPKFLNGTFEADVTPQSSPLRLGLVLRANDHNQRLYVGYGDADKNWFWEFWNGTSSNYSGMHSGPQLKVGKTSHIKAEIDGNKLSLWVDGVTVMDKVTVDGNIPSEAGYVGFNKRNGGSVIFDNLEVNVKDVQENTNAVNGSIVDSSQAPVYMAEVSLVNSAQEVAAKTMTNLLGEYSVKNVPYGTYTLKVSKNGYAAKEIGSVEVKAGDPTSVTKIILNPAVNRNALNDALKKAAALKASDYTKVTWKVLADAVAAAGKLTETSTQAQVDAAARSITNAMTELAKIAVKTTLNQKIAAARAIKIGNYTDASFKILTNTIAAAQAVAANENATQQQVDAQVAALANAVKGLKIDANKQAVAKVKAATVSAKVTSTSINQIRIKWNRVTDASGYVVRVKASGGKWSTAANITKNKTTTFTYKKAKANKTYSFMVKAYRKSGGQTVYSKYRTVSAKAIPGTVSLKTSVKKGKVNLSWAKVSNVSGYVLEKKSGSKWKKLVTIKSGAKYADKEVKKGKKYSYRIKAYKKAGSKTIYGKYSAVKTIKAK